MRASMPGWVPGPSSVTVSEPHAAEPSRTARRTVAPAVRDLMLLFMVVVFLSWFRRVLSAVTGLTQERGPRYVRSRRAGKVGCRGDPPVSVWFDVHVSAGSVDDQTYVVTIEERWADVEGTRMHELLALDDLVTRARAGDQASWNALVDRFLPLVNGVIRRFRLSSADA